MYAPVKFEKCTSDKNRLQARKVDGCCYDLDQTENTKN